MEGISARPARSAASSCPSGLRESDRAAGTDFHAGDKSRPPATTSISAKRKPARSSAATRSRSSASLTLRLYSRGAAHAEHRGIIVADTKFEFGRVIDGPNAGDIILIDEVLTPDSSRFWPRDLYRPGGPQPSFDKQFVRDYLETIRWNKQPPVPEPARRCHREDPREVRAGVPHVERLELE